MSWIYTRGINNGLDIVLILINHDEKRKIYDPELFNHFLYKKVL